MLGPEDVTSALVQDVSAIPPLVQANFGIIPRAIIHIFEHIREGVRESTEFLIKCSYIEVYNEAINCLLSTPPALNLRIREFPHLGMCVIGQAETFVTTPEEVFECLALGTLNRITGATLQNSRSSRSHTLFIITMEQKFFDGSVKTAKLNLVDLAGSEKISKTGAQGARLKEAQNINLSLTTLGRCIKALASAKEKHIPFRESKLTMILKESLGGNAKTTLLCTASPKKVHFDESISTLQFAERAKKIQIKAKVNKTESIEELNALISQLKEEVNILRKQLKDAGSNPNPDAQIKQDDEDIYIQFAELKAKHEHYQEAAQLEIEQLKQKFEMVIMDTDSSVADDHPPYLTSPFENSEEMEEYEEMRRHLEQELVSSKVVNDELQGEIVALKAESNNLTDALKEAKKAVEFLEVEKYEWEDRLCTEESRWKTERLKVEELENRLDRKTRECENWKKEYSDQVAKMIEIHEETMRVQATLTTSQQKVEETEQALADLTQAFHAQSSELQSTKQSLQDTQDSLASLTFQSSEEIAKLRSSEEVLRISLNQLTEENHSLERKLEASESRSSGRSQQDLNRSFEFERRSAVSKETISKLMDEMKSLQQAFEHTQSRHQKNVIAIKLSNAEKVDALETTIDELNQKLTTEIVHRKKLEEAVKIAEMEEDCSQFKNKLLKEELVSLQRKHAEALKLTETLSANIEKLNGEKEAVSAASQRSLEGKRQQFEAMKTLKDTVQDLNGKIGKLTAEHDFMRKTLEMKERIIAKLKGTEDYVEFNLEESMMAQKRNISITQPSRRMSSKLSTFAVRANQDSMRPRMSEDHLGRRSMMFLPTANLAYALQNVSALYSSKDEEVTDSAE